MMYVGEITARKVAFVANIVLCNVGWFANVSLAAKGYPYGGPLIECLLVAVHLAFVVPAYDLNRLNEAMLMMATICYAMVVDTSFGFIFEFFPWTVPPPFIFALWANFAMSLNISCGFLHNTPYPWIPAILGLVFGPLTYLSGANMGAIALPAAKTYFLIVIAVEWTVTLPLLTSYAGYMSPKYLRELYQPIP